MGIVAEVFNLTTGIISAIGYPGIFGLMLLEGMLLPIPSEVVMAFGGYLIYTGQLTGFLYVPAFLILLLVGTFGNLSGAMIAYYIGYYGGEPLIVRYGKYVFLDEASVKHVQRWFQKYGPESVFGTRLVPIFRTFISIPAGIGKMNIRLFASLTFLGSLIWDSVLIYFGISLGRNWQKIILFFDQYQYVAIGAIIVLVGLFFINKLAKKRTGNSVQ
ncbi:MAG: DedA family protein [Candidatus Thermoplasmatota archaeon]|nr:DedA family protein [Candidatus Thermoplasmatota archaeon]